MPVVPIISLKKLAWNGIPDELRPMVWQILLGYLPCDASSRVDVLASKRKEYQRSVELAFQNEGGLDQAVWHQIRIDVPRTSPHLSLYQFEATQKVVTLWIETYVGSWEDSLCLGYSTSWEWVCTGDKWPCNSILSSFSFCLYWYVLLWTVLIKIPILKHLTREHYPLTFLHHWKLIHSGAYLHC